MATGQVSLKLDTSDDPRFAVCYARGSVFRPEKEFHKVEPGMRARVHRSLCLVSYYGTRCERCPNHNLTVTLGGAQKLERK